MTPYHRYLQAELRAWGAGDTRKATILARWKARAYSMYAIQTPYR